MAASESSVRHIVGFYSYADYLLLKKQYLNKPNASEANIAGLCFQMKRISPGGFNDSIKVLLVDWIPPSAGGAPDAIGFTDAETVPAIPGTASRPVIKELSVISAFDTIQHYQNTREFDYVFIDIATFLYFAAPTSNSFYRKDPNNGKYFHPVQPSSASSSPVYINDSDRGLMLARATFTLRTENGFERFRTLRMYPGPEPTLSATEANRPAISYMLGPACPPIWRDMGNDPLVVAASAPAPASGIAPVTHSLSPKFDDSIGGQPSCDCVSNNIDMLALHHKLIESGHVDKEPAPVFRKRLWPYILLLIILLILSIFGAIALSKGLHFKND
ncbi:MAG: hypothetical protein WCR52_17290 [Bacteroidota bacterium]|uniref:hypothetical protein n=1 Tax=Runella sp. TaxID=1960881 RepID=UPI003016F85C